MDFAVEHILNRHWAMTQEILELMIETASRDHEIKSKAEDLSKKFEAIKQGEFTAIQEKIGIKLSGSNNVFVRNGVAVIDVIGPLFRYANLFTMVCGGVSYENLSRDIALAAKDPNITNILLNIDSPGGEVNGCWEISNQIYKLRGSRTPVTAFISGTGCSGAYWIASACNQIASVPTAIVGSIGVQATYRIQAEDSKNKTIRIVSSKSPKKNLPVESSEGLAEIQNEIDDLADIFIQSIATHRGVSTKTVEDTYGQGGIFVAKKSTHMVDLISSFEDVIVALQRK